MFCFFCFIILISINQQLHTSGVGFISEDVPELLATKDRKSLDPMDIVAVLTKVSQEQQKTISKLTERLNELEREVKLKGCLASVNN